MTKRQIRRLVRREIARGRPIPIKWGGARIDLTAHEMRLPNDFAERLLEHGAKLRAAINRAS